VRNPSASSQAEPVLSLYHLLDPAVLANPYPLYRRLREESPVHWDPYLHAWVVTRYEDVVTVLHRFRAERSPRAERLLEIGLGQLAPISEMLVRMMLFLDNPEHRRVRTLAAAAFTPRRVAHLRDHIRDVTVGLIDTIDPDEPFDLIDSFAAPLPAIVTAEMLGVPASDHMLLKAWSADVAEMLGNFQHNPGQARRMLTTFEEIVTYFEEALRRERAHPTEGVINALATAEIDGDRFSEEEIIANIVITMVGGQETTTNLIANGVLTLLRQPELMEELRADSDGLLDTAVEEFLRYESPTQQTARMAPPGGATLGGRDIPEGAAVIAVLGAGNRDPERFPDPDVARLDRDDNRHLAFGWAGHFCFGAPLARIEGRLAFEHLLERFPKLSLEPDNEIRWRLNLSLRGLDRLVVRAA
jgi:cytochrome P450